MIIDVRDLSFIISQCITKATVGDVQVFFVDIAFRDVLNFWQYASERDNEDYRYHFILLTRIFVFLLYKWRSYIIEASDFPIMNKSIEVDDIAETQLKLIKRYYSESETLFAMELEVFIECFTYRKLVTMHMTPKEYFYHGDCLAILEESTSACERSSEYPWINLYYIPMLKYGLPHGPCIVQCLGGKKKRKNLQARLERRSHYTEIIAENEMSDQCVFCIGKVLAEENFTILDCCTHLVCKGCKKLHAWKEW